MNEQCDGLRGLRKARGLTQAALADMVGVHQTMISQLEQGSRKFSFDLALRLAKALNVSVIELGEAVGEFEPDASAVA